MNYFTYIIQSIYKKSYYIGYTHNLASRIDKHNSGSTKSTKSRIPWELVYFEQFETKSEAIKRELEIKSKKSRKYIELLIEAKGGRPD